MSASPLPSPVDAFLAGEERGVVTKLAWIMVSKNADSDNRGHTCQNCSTNVQEWMDLHWVDQSWYEAQVVFASEQDIQIRPGRGCCVQ